MNSTSDQLMKWRDNPDWYARIEQNIEEYERLAAIGYTPDKIAMYYRINRSEFMWAFNLVDSPLRYHYERGQMMQQAKEGIAMAAAAEKGDNVTQAQRFDKLRTAIGYKNAIDQVFFDAADNLIP